MSRTKIVAVAMAGTLAVTTATPMQPAFAQNASESSESSSELGGVIGALVLIAAFMGLYGWFSPYNQNGAWANASK